MSTRMETATPVTTRPVTTSGWYEHTDGTVGRYLWAKGVPVLRETVASWAETTSEEERLQAGADAEDAEMARRARLASEGEVVS